jgi:hypothetical protein
MAARARLFFFPFRQAAAAPPSPHADEKTGGDFLFQELKFKILIDISWLTVGRGTLCEQRKHLSLSLSLSSPTPPHRPPKRKTRHLPPGCDARLFTTRQPNIKV